MIERMKQLTLASKIGGGFGLVILLLLVISVVSWNGLSSIAEDFVSYRGLARDSNLAGRLQANMLMVRMNVKDFIISQNDKEIEEYQEYFNKMKGFLDEAQVEIQQPDRAALIDEYSEDIDVYNENFNKVISLYHQRDKIVNETLNVIGPEMEKKLTRIMQSAKEDSDAEAAYEAGQTLRRLLLGRLYVIKYLDTNSDKDKARVDEEFAGVFSSTKTLDELLQNPERRKLNEEVKSMSHKYLEAFHQLNGTITLRNDIIHNTLDVMGPEMAEDVEIVKLSVKEEQDKLGPIVQAKSQNAVRLVMIVAIIAILIAIVAAILITRTITKPVQQVVTFVEELSTGDFTTSLQVNQQDEIGKMSQALGKTVGELGSMIKEIITGIATLSSSSSDLSAIAAQLSGNAEEGQNRANGVASSAEEMSSNMNSVSAAMEQSSSNVQMVATATEEMSATVNEIAQNAERAQGISEEAVIQSKATSQKINQLGQAAEKIGRVTETITEISEQTNLLALNATIEAARAGEAGKGFAVVANEIKDLAKQTAEATVDIKNQIENMQSTTDGTIGDIEKIGQVIEDINDVITTIATAVEEQSTATSEISGNVSQAAAGITEVNENVANSSMAAMEITRDISEISRGADEINSASSNVQGSATDLSKLADELSQLVRRFKVS